ncbi:IclR family transcriptional regulator [Mesorhizobium sp. M3A.F.Ca.ET.201.01.1.1]|uniref:IclR family transcriptional regulator n=1 Tax=Mesorhizobium sp. M3A.F.Ca.ET.201.01.1.1 TaxID=2563946 RepID=UPI001093D8EA|nr:IclR family transcriptional regulator [Mesorhizobium sp. M3A.F.Ca.ET.201.01.1.1]TGS71765.1 IclR family transcriptional regulator [Mesorhizobium sp. M3A.F.Ca.ET.201.01.1.1]
MSEDKYIVKPLVSAIYVMEALRSVGVPMTLSQVSEITGVSKTTSFRYLKTLVLMGYAVLQPGNKYTLGPAAFALGGDDNKETALENVAKGEMETLVHEFGETVNLGMPKGKHIHYIAILEPKRALRLKAESGDADCFHSTALGKAMIAFMPKEQVDFHLKSRLPRFTDHTLTSRRQLDQALTMVRRYGYAIDREENEIGCVCYAAPIFGWGESPIAAISVSIPSPRLNDDLDLRVPERVKSSASSITEKLRRLPMSTDQMSNLKSRRGSGSAVRT